MTFFYDRTEIENTSVTVEVIGMIRFSFILDVTFFYDRTEKENTSVTVKVIGVLRKNKKRIKMFCTRASFRTSSRRLSI